MKRIAILVIAATNQPIYIHYIKSHWTQLIQYSKSLSNVDIFLLFEQETDLSEFNDLSENIIRDETINLNQLVEPKHQTINIPGILSKTIYAYELLQNQYDVFFRTNLSSYIRLSDFDHYVQNKEPLYYSGSVAWSDALRDNLLHHGMIGPDKSIKSLSELDRYEGNTFISGSGFFLNSDEVKDLVKKKHEIRYDITDDVSIGLMFQEHEVLSGFSHIFSSSQTAPEIIDITQRSTCCHFRLEHFPVDKAKAVWEKLRCSNILI